jgi:hypothetical protein
MIKISLNTPILFLIFNRLETTKRVFDEIKKARPKQLFIASDGPRENKVGEKEVVEKIREYVLKNINWKCKVKTLFRKKNIGCKYAVSGAIDWFFDNVEQGIILEDDCLPSQSFFRFCQDTLEKYRYENKIMQVSGTNVEGVSKTKEDYFFTDCFNAWGWATWKRAWNKYDVNMNDWRKYRTGKIFRFMNYNRLSSYLQAWRLFDMTYRNKINTWDYQWIFSCITNKGLCIIPKKNLITNMGFTSIATHTSNYQSEDKQLIANELKFPLKENDRIEINPKYLNSYYSFFGKTIWQKIFEKIFQKR